MDEESLSLSFWPFKRSVEVGDVVVDETNATGKSELNRPLGVKGRSGKELTNPIEQRANVQIQIGQYMVGMEMGNEMN